MAEQAEVKKKRVKILNPVKNIISQALSTGYYKNKRIREGEVFICTDENEFSYKWMKDVKGVLKQTAEIEAAKAAEHQEAFEAGAPVGKPKQYVEIDGKQVEIVDLEDETPAAAAPEMVEAATPAAAPKAAKGGKKAPSAPTEVI